MKTRVFSLSMLSGSMDDDIIIPFLDGLVEAGYQGVCPHPRNGLKIPYPSRLYWQKLARMIELAQERGLDIWHYDEFPYPSGQLGGMLVEDHPHMASQILVFEPVEALSNKEGYINIGRGSLLALLRYRQTEEGNFSDIEEVTADTGSHLDSWVCSELNNLGYTATKRLHREDHERAFPLRLLRYYAPLEPLQQDEKLMAVKIKSARAGDGLKSTGMPDLTRPEVTEFFLTHIYTKLAEIGVAHQLADTPVFQDEVTFYSAFPWNETIESTLRSVWKKDFAANLMALNDPDVPGWEWARFQYRSLCAEQLEKNWYIQVKDFCHKNHLRMTGHLPGEETISAHAQIMGDAFKNLRHFDIPGYDIISSTLPDDMDRSHATGIKLVQSVAWIEGQKPTMAEAFGANGFHQDLQRNRTVVAWLAAHDIFQICDHATFSDSRSMAKYDAPPIHNRFNPMHTGAPDLWNWHHWFCDLMEQYQFNPETLVLFPFDALTRYILQEKRWEPQTTLLESFFHYLCAHSLDCIFLPSHLLAEVKTVSDGFEFRGHHFKNFVVPPFRSLHESVFDLLKPLQDQPGFSWILPEQEKGIEIFGKNNPHGTFQEIAANIIKNCNEEELVETGVSWFDDLLDSPLQQIHSPRSIMKSLRVDRKTSEKLLLLINPHDDEIEITAPYFGEPLPQPPENNYMENSASNGTKVLLAPRATAVFRYDDNSQKQSMQFTEITSYSAKWRVSGKNFWSLKEGSLCLQGHEKISFIPGAVSSLWDNDPSADETQSSLFPKSFNTSDLKAPLGLTATFSVRIEGPFSELLVVLDTDSMPPDAKWFWDDIEITATERDVFETQNNAYDIPQELLTSGLHQLQMRAQVSNGAQGILERPVLKGDFAVIQTTPLHLGLLFHEWKICENTLPLWQEIGLPEAYGPVEYKFEFDVPEINNQAVQLQLPPCIGVAEISVNDQTLGRSNWEPRIIPIPIALLHQGTNTIAINLHGSWNNIFSRLNQRENGLHGNPVLRLFQS